MEAPVSASAVGRVLCQDLKHWGAVRDPNLRAASPVNAKVSTQKIADIREEDESMTRRTSVRTPDTPPGGVLRRTQRILSDERLDPYQARGKYREPTVCGDCGAVFRRGRWAHGAAPDVAKSDHCPACRRIREKLPAGRVFLEGSFYASHRDEILSLMRHEADSERSQHPINRIMNIEDDTDRRRGDANCANCDGYAAAGSCLS